MWEPHLPFYWNLLLTLHKGRDPVCTWGALEVSYLVPDTAPQGARRAGHRLTAHLRPEAIM
eukprot:2626363-Prymnesium_polylepis.1